MAKILVCGLCPLPFENTEKNYGPGIRSWQFARSLAKAGHEVRLVAMIIPNVYQEGELLAEEERDGVQIFRLDGESFMDPATVRGHVDALGAEILLGATIYGSFAISRIHPELPFWADQFGHVMAEAQAKAALEGDNWPLAHWWKMVHPVIQRADRISTVSDKQRYATIGELGAIGRLTSETCGYEFTAEIPCALVPAADQPVRPILRGTRVPDDAFIALWSGGYNVWSDVDTLFAGVENAMRKLDRVVFVSTGGEIAGHDTQTYRRFVERIRESPYRDRFHLEGWVQAELVPSYYAEADLGVLTETVMYEGQLGSKNRVVQWMGDGLPVAYNRVGDLGNLLATEDLGLTFEPGDAAGLADAILWAASRPDDLGQLAERARQAVLEKFSFEATTEPLLRWAESPSRAPDAASYGKIRSPLDHGEVADRLSVQAQRLAPVRESRVLRSLWRRLTATVGR